MINKKSAPKEFRNQWCKRMRRGTAGGTGEQEKDMRRAGKIK